MLYFVLSTQNPEFMSDCLLLQICISVQFSFHQRSLFVELSFVCSSSNLFSFSIDVFGEAVTVPSPCVSNSDTQYRYAYRYIYTGMMDWTHTHFTETFGELVVCAFFPLNLWLYVCVCVCAFSPIASFAANVFANSRDAADKIAIRMCLNTRAYTPTFEVLPVRVQLI